MQDNESALAVDEEASGAQSSAYLPDLPFFPVATYENIADSIGVWWFEADFSQSTYGRNSSVQSRACSLIAILTAAGIERECVESTPKSLTLPHSLVKVFAESILLGNRIYTKLAASHQLVNENFSVPEAMDATKVYTGNLVEWKSFVYMDDLGEKLFHCLTDGLSTWWTENQSCHQRRVHLFVVLITEHRTLLLAFQQHPSMISVFDSHQHSPMIGSCIAQAPMEHVFNMCHWIRSLFHEVYQVQPTCFELSFIHTKESGN